MKHIREYRRSRVAVRGGQDRFMDVLVVGNQRYLNLNSLLFSYGLVKGAYHVVQWGIGLGAIHVPNGDDNRLIRRFPRSGTGSAKQHEHAANYKTKPFLCHDGSLTYLELSIACQLTSNTTWKSGIRGLYHRR